VPELIGKILYQWDLQVNYQTLTIKESQGSVYRAEAANLICDKDTIKIHGNDSVTEKLEDPSKNERTKWSIIDAINKVKATIQSS